MSVDQFVFASPISEKEALPGDLVFTNSPMVEGGKNVVHFASYEWMRGTSVPHGIDHVGVIGDSGHVIHATRWGNRVRKELLMQSERFAGERWFGRVIEDSEPRFVVRVPVERLDLRSTVDLIEEVGRHLGYDTIEPTLPTIAGKGVPTTSGYYADKVRALLLERGYSEIVTYSFVPKGAHGEIVVQNPVGQDRPYIRGDLASTMVDALARNIYHAPLIGIDDVRVFEFGHVFRIENGSMKESLSLIVANATAQRKRGAGLAEEIDTISEEITALLGENCGKPPPWEVGTVGASGAASFWGNTREIDFDRLVRDLPQPTAYESILPARTAVTYRSLSVYPFIVRDVAFFVPHTTEESMIEETIRDAAGELAVRVARFDRFQKSGDPRVSYAYRIVLQSFDRTLTDDDASAVMATVTGAITEKGWEIR
jgi:phenylalanyl-tRNA synthetase beta chain